MLPITFVILISYLIGSIPTAYLITKWYAKTDLRFEGSRNIGARNAYEVTSNKTIGILILIVDLLKGALPIFVLFLFDYSGLIPFAAASLVLGHCYPIWLRFHGGRGLATAAGIVLLVSPLLIVVWLFSYLLSELVKSNVHLQAVAATIVTAAIALLFSHELLSFFSYTSTGWSNEVLLRWQYGATGIFVVIVSRHIEPLKGYFIKA